MEQKIDGDRLWASLMEMARIGATPKGGVCRLALTDLDREGRDLFVKWCKEAGCTVKIDRMGNIVARRPGRNNDLAPVLTGSHLDSQCTGGRFDGVCGVLAGLEAIRTLNDLGIETEQPVEASVWTNEEGSRFAPAMVASGVHAGVFTLDSGRSRADADGKTMGEELDCIGYAGMVRDGAQRLGYATCDIVSGAGHDACYLSKVTPTAMIFVPCIGGIGHNEIEDAKPEGIEADGNVLFQAMLASRTHAVTDRVVGQ